MHRVEFEVRIRIALHSNVMDEASSGSASGAASGERRDIRLNKKVYILPGAAGRVEQAADWAAVAPSGMPPTEAESIPGPSTPVAATKPVELTEKQKAKQAAAHAEASSGIFAGFDLQEEFDGYEDIGRPLTDSPTTESDPSAAGPSTTGAMTEEQHERNLEELRQFLEQGRMLQREANAPPPTLQESRHDVQVEVEVEGVGMAMPREYIDQDALDYARRNDYHHDLSSHPDQDLYDPPPPMSPMIDRTPPSELLMAVASSRVQQNGIGQTVLNSSGTEDHDASAPPSFGDATGETVDGRPRDNSRVATTQPPPYRDRGGAATPSAAAAAAAAVLRGSRPARTTPRSGSGDAVEPTRSTPSALPALTIPVASPLVSPLPALAQPSRAAVDNRPPAYARRPSQEMLVSDLPVYEEDPH